MFSLMSWTQQSQKRLSPTKQGGRRSGAAKNNAARAWAVAWREFGVHAKYGALWRGLEAVAGASSTPLLGHGTSTRCCWGRDKPRSCSDAWDMPFHIATEARGVDAVLFSCAGNDHPRPLLRGWLHSLVLVLGELAFLLYETPFSNPRVSAMARWTLIGYYGSFLFHMVPWANLRSYQRALATDFMTIWWAPWRHCLIAPRCPAVSFSGVPAAAVTLHSTCVLFSAQDSASRSPMLSQPGIHRTGWGSHRLGHVRADMRSADGAFAHKTHNTSPWPTGPHLYQTFVAVNPDSEANGMLFPRA